nr:putative Ig domain-containing protein [uncultured Arsenicibacter sp.]
MINRLRNYFLLIITALLILPVSLNAQVLTRRSTAGIPVDKSGAGQGSPRLVLPAVAVDQLIAEDDAAAKLGVPFRFGTKRDVDVNITGDGMRSESGGYRFYHYQIYSEGAYSLNLLFDRFRLVDGASLYIYNPGQTMVIGPITSAQNPANNQYWTDIIAGSQLTIELREPLSAAESSDLHLSGVVHGYRNLFPDKNQDKVFGSSSSCELNVTCYPNLQNEADGVVMILIDQATRLCTGSMVNTTRQSFRSFLLTAFHCIDIGTYVNNVRTSYNDGVLTSAEVTQAQNWLIRFNYQSPTCNPSQEDNEVVTLNGSVLRASYSQSDFALMEINQQVPVDVNTTYLGWNKANANAINAFTIHHPQGDVKKVSFTNADTQISGYGNSSGSDHLTVSWGSLGVTEGGSSGSPLFDANKRIVGQLHGGPSYCGAPSYLLADYYGRFYTSWAGNGNVGARLSDWLDPLGINTEAINGVKAIISGPSAFTGSGTFSLNVNDGSSVSWAVSPANALSVSSGTGNTANLVATGIAGALTITFTVNAGQSYPITFSKSFSVSPNPPTPPVIPNQTATAAISYSYVTPVFQDILPLTYAASGLPAGLSYNASARTISGVASVSGVFAITIYAINTSNLISQASFQLTVDPPPYAPLTLLEPVYDCTTRKLVFQSSGGVFNMPIQYMSIGITGWTTSTSFIVESSIVNDPTTAPFTLFARQNGTVVSRMFDFRQYCINKSPGQPPAAPVVYNQSVNTGSSFTYIVPAFSSARPLTYAATGLPAGLTFSAATRLISGITQSTGTSTIMVTATDDYNLSSSISFVLTVNPANTPANSLSLIAPTYNCSTGAIRFNTAGGNGTTIRYMAVGITPWTTNPNQTVDAGVRNDPNSAALVLTAEQNGIVVTKEFNPRQYCSNQGQNYAPVAPLIPNQIAIIGQPYSYTLPTFYDDQPLTYYVSPLPSGLSINTQKTVISGTPNVQGNFNVSITAIDPNGLSANVVFMFSVYATAPATFTMISPIYDCQTRQISFRTTGGNGTTVQYMAVGVTGWTTNPIQTIDAAVVADPNNNFITIVAQQNGIYATYNFNFRQACGSAREAIHAAVLDIRILENPTTQPTVSARISGSAGLPLTVELIDLQGQVLATEQIGTPSDDEPVTLRLTKPAGLYLLRARNQQQVKTVKIIKGQ